MVTKRKKNGENLYKVTRVQAITCIIIRYTKIHEHRHRVASHSRALIKLVDKRTYAERQARREQSDRQVDRAFEYLAR